MHAAVMSWEVSKWEIRGIFRLKKKRNGGRKESECQIAERRRSGKKKRR